MNNKLKFLIVTPSYNENCGGHIVLHKLCDELNSNGYIACITPLFNNYIINKNNWLSSVFQIFKDINRSRKKLKINKSFKTPIATKDYITECKKNGVVIYPELVLGNPLEANNVVRWFLHHPQNFNSKIMYGFDELYFKYSSWINIPESIKRNVVDELFRIVYYPFDLYNEDDVAKVRDGSAYTIRKGVGKPLVHDVTNSILIDNLSHQEIASIFKRVKTFYSYDLYTAYSAFAVLCGCDSVVIPDKNMTKEQWIPDGKFRAGLSYGFDDLPEARRSRDYMIKQMKEDQDRNKVSIEMFVTKIRDFFGQRINNVER